MRHNRLLAAPPGPYRVASDHTTDRHGGPMATVPAVSLKHHFAGLIDPRGERSRLHELLDVVGIALCAVIAGAESWPAVEAYGHAKRDWLARHFRLTNGIPSHDTFRRVFCLLAPQSFQQSFADWIAALA